MSLNRKCSECCNVFPWTPDNFYWKYKAKSVLQPICKDCSKQKSKTYRLKNKEKANNASMLWRQRNKKRVRVLNSAYYAANKGKINANKKTKYRANPAKMKEQAKKWAAENPERKKETDRLWKERNRKRVNANSSRWHSENKEKHNESCSEWRSKNKQKVSAIQKKCHKKRMLDPQKKLSLKMKNAIGHSLRGGKNGVSWTKLVDYDVVDLKNNIERKFKPGMTWENYGEWHIDHITPVSAFNFAKPEHADFKRCWALDNLQPLWAKENLSKSNKLGKPFQPSLLL